MNSWKQWQKEFVDKLIESGLAPAQAGHYMPGGRYEGDAINLWNKGYSIDLSVMHELLGPNDPSFMRRRTMEAPQKRKLVLP